MMINSEFFSEAQIVANHALGFADPIGVGIEKGIKYLRQKRYNPDHWSFTDRKFNMYAEHYAKLAECMIKEYQLYKKACDAGVFDLESV